MKTVKLIRASTLLLLAISQPLRATEHFVTVDDTGFNPSNLQIVEGDTVTWINDDEFDFPHSTVSDLPPSNPNYWSGLVFGYSDMFSWTFTNIGTFTYTDTLDVGTGSITVIDALAPIPVPVGNARLSGGKFLFNGGPLTVGRTNILETSTNLVNWMAISTNLNTSATITFTNNVSGKASYFRLFELPPPLPPEAGM